MSSAVHDSAVTNRSDPILDDVLEEVANRLQAGDPVDCAAILARYPEHAESLARLLPAIEVMAEFGVSASRLAARGVPPGLGPRETALGTLGDFRILREVGRGGMGVVYEAEQMSLGRRVALKVLPFAAALDPQQLRRFKTEAQAAAQLHHTNIVPVFWVGCEQGVHYYAMQFIEGRSLAEVIRDLRQLEGKEQGGRENATGSGEILPSPPRPSGERSPQDVGGEGVGEGARRQSPLICPSDIFSPRGEGAGEGAANAVETGGILPSPQGGEGARRAGEGEALEPGHHPVSGCLLESRLEAESGSPLKSGLEAESESSLESRLQAVRGPAKAGTPTPVGRGSPDPGRARTEGLPLPPTERPTPSPTTPSTRNRAYFRNVARLGIEAALALEHAHQEGIIHRDIKPANLMVDARGHLWVTDFGLARLQSDSGLTITGDVIGTLRYMSPEQALGRRVLIDARTDIYSLGVTLYELMTLQPAFESRDRQELLRRIADEEPRSPRQLNSSIPRELETIILKAMSKEAESRYATAQELADDLRRFLDNKPIKAKRPALLERAAKWARRHRTVVAMGVFFLLLAVAALATSTLLIARERAEAVRQRDRARVQLAAATTAREAESRAHEQAEAVGRFLVDAFQRPDPEQDGRELKVMDLLTAAAAKLDAEFTGSPKIKGALLDALGRTLDQLGLPAQAADTLEKALAVRQAALGRDHDDTLATGNRLGEAYINAGRTSEALALLEAVLTRRQATLGPDHDDTLDAQNNLAVAYERMGDLARAVPLLERTLEARKSKLGPDHDATLSTQNCLAAAFSDAGRNAESLSLFEATLKAREARLGPDDPKVLLSRNNLAFALNNAGRPAEAIPLLEKTLKLRESKLGPDHPHTINSRTNLATAYGKSGDPARATPLFEHALKQRIAALGSDHPKTLVAQANLGRNYHRVGRPAEGARLLEEVLRRARDRPDAMAQLGRLTTVLAAAYDASGQFPRSEPLYREVLAKARKSFGPDDPRTAGWMAQLGWNLLKQEKWPEAELILRGSLAVREKTQPNAWNTLNTRSMLGGALLGQGKLAEAEPLIVQGYEAMKAREATIPSEGQPLLTEAAERLVLLYQQTGRPDQAAALLGVTNHPRPTNKKEATTKQLSKP